MGKGARNRNIRKIATSKKQARQMRKFARQMKRLGLKVEWN